MPLRPYLAAFVLLISSASALQAKGLIYQPQNPSFGGPTNNGPTLMSTAQAQNHFTAPAPPTPSAAASAAANQSLTQQQMFASQLQSQLLSSLASQVNAAIFGPNAAPSGTFIYGTETITFNRTLTSVNVNILDTSTGQNTQVQVPLVQVSP